MKNYKDCRENCTIPMAPAADSSLTEIVFILDASGSMYRLEKDTIGGFNGMIDKQKKQEGTALVTTVLFSDRSRVVHDRIRLDRVPPMTDDDYRTGGCTALLDAIGHTIKHISTIHKYARREDLPQKTIFAITTNGMENASRRYSFDEIKKLIDDRRKNHGWEFLFLGANIDAIETAGKMGIEKELSANYINDAKGIDTMTDYVDSAISLLRCNKAVTADVRQKLDADYNSRKR